MGYFRIFYYITYILNFLLRLIKRHGKAVLWFICIAVFLVICLYNPKSQAVYIGNEVNSSYQTIYQKYDSICIDFIRRFDRYRNQQGAINVDFLINRFKTYDYYIYYQSSGTDDGGLSSVDGGLFNDYFMRVLFYDYRNSYMSFNYSAYEEYYGIEDQIREITYSSGFNDNMAYISSNLFFQSTPNNSKFYIPQSLFHYQNKYIYEYFVNNTSLKEIELMYEMNQKLSSVDETLQQQQEYLEQEPSSEDFTTEDLPTDSGVTATTDSGLNSFFTSFYNGFIAEPNYAQHTIKVPIPFTRKAF